MLHHTINIPEHYANTPELAPTVVVIHGLFGAADNLNIIARHLSEHYRVIKLDLPDHGKSPWTEAFSFENYAKQIRDTLLQLGINKADFVAHSLGGKISMYLSLIHPELINKLVVLDIAPVVYEARHHNVIRGLSAVKLDEITSRQDALEYLSAHVIDKSTQSFLLKSLYQHDQRWQWRFNLALLIRDYTLLSDWPHNNHGDHQNQAQNNSPSFEGPVLFIKGQHSDYILPEHQSTIIKFFPNAKAKIVNAGHWLHAEKPQVVNSLITKFLRGDEN